MMICECGCHDRVVRTISADGEVTRTRRCISCGKIVETVERKIPAAAPDKKPRPTKKKATAPKAVAVAKEKPEPKGALQRALAAAK